MSFLLSVKKWLTRGAFLLAGVLAGVLGFALWNRDRDEEEEEASAEDYQREQDEFETLAEISQEKREEILCLPDDDFDKRYPSVPRDARTGGDRFVDRCRNYLQSRGSRSDSGRHHDNRSGGDGEDKPGNGP